MWRLLAAVWINSSNWKKSKYSSSGEWTNKLWVFFSRTLLSNERGWNMTRNNMEKPQKHYAKGKKSNTKDYILWFHSCVILEKAKRRWQKDQWLPGAAAGGGSPGIQGSFWCRKKHSLCWLKWSHNFINLPAFIKLHTQHEWILLHINDVLIFKDFFFNE